MSDEKQDNNMALWDSVSETNPEITKHVNQRGGFTAICAQAQRKRATELWGPYGGAWGIREVVYGYVTKTIGEDTDPVEMWIEGHFYYPDGTFHISSDIKWKAGDDCRKKLLTDITTKSLSLLGFNSDVFEGRFDDNKYVQGQTKIAKTRDVIEAMKGVESDKPTWEKYAAKAMKMSATVGDANQAKIDAYIDGVKKGEEAAEVF